MATLPLSSTSFPPWDQTSQCTQSFPSPTAWPSARPAGVPFAFRAWQSLRKPGRSFGIPSKPAAFTWLSRWTMRLPMMPSGSAIHLPSRVP